MASSRPLRAAAIGLAATTVALAALLALTWTRVRQLGTTIEDLERDVGRIKKTNAARAAEAALPISPLLVSYQLDLPGRGEVFPAMAATDAPEYWPIAILRVSNTANRALAQTVAGEIPGWSSRTEQTVVLGPRETRKVRIQPELLPRAYENDEIRRAVLEVRATGPGKRAVRRDPPRADPRRLGDLLGPPLRQRPGHLALGDAADPAVLKLVATARRFVPGGRLAGYAGGGARGEEQVRAQARAVYPGPAAFRA